MVAGPGNDAAEAEAKDQNEDAEWFGVGSHRIDFGLVFYARLIS
jgi:hypothetical protein